MNLKLRWSLVVGGAVALVVGLALFDGPLALAAFGACVFLLGAFA